MKNTTMKIMTLFIAVSMILAACSKKDSASNESIDETMLYGEWQSTQHIVNGQTYNAEVTIIINEDGTGTIAATDVQNTLTFPFTWVLSGNSIKITASNNTAKFKIEDLTENQITISGDSFPGAPNMGQTSYKGTYNKVFE